MITKYLISILGLLSLSMSQPLQDKQVFDLMESKVVINGTCNITDYSCNLNDLSNNKNLHVSSFIDRVNNNVQLKGSKIHLKIDEFDCKSRPMDHNLQKALNTKNHPFIQISIDEFSYTKNFTIPYSEKNVPSKISITMAGVTRHFVVELDSIYFSDNRISMKGNGAYKMTEFDIIPPVVMFGLIKTNDNVDIDFNLNFIKR